MDAMTSVKMPSYTSTPSNPGRVTDAELRRELLKDELVQYLVSLGYKVRTEVMMRKICDTEAYSPKHKEYRDRSWRCDFVAEYELEHGTYQIVIEVNGGQWTNGRHNRGGAYEDSLRKRNRAQAKGVNYFEYTYEMLARQEYKHDIE